MAGSESCWLTLAESAPTTRARRVTPLPVRARWSARRGWCACFRAQYVDRRHHEERERSPDDHSRTSMIPMLLRDPAPGTGKDQRKMSPSRSRRWHPDRAERVPAASMTASNLSTGLLKVFANSVIKFVSRHQSTRVISRPDCKCDGRSPRNENNNAPERASGTDPARMRRIPKASNEPPAPVDQDRRQQNVRGIASLGTNFWGATHLRNPW